MFAVLAVAYYALGSWLWSRGIVSLDLLGLSEKARLGLAGAAPRLANLGFVVPPLPLLLMLPFADPLVAQAVVAGALVALLTGTIARTVADPWIRATGIAYVWASPLFLFLSVERYPSLLFCALLASALVAIVRYLRSEYSLPLFAAGTAYGLTFFVDFRSIALLPFLLFAAALPWLRAARARAIAVALTVGFPITFLSLAWMYVNWVFFGDPLAFVNDKASFFRMQSIGPETLSSGAGAATVRYGLARLVPALAVVLPYLCGFFALGGGRTAHAASLRLVYLMPAVLFVCELCFGVFVPTASFLALFVLTFLLCAAHMRGSAVTRAALLLSLAASFVLPLSSPSAEERAFSRALFGFPAESNVAEYRAVAETIDGLAPGKVLLDDRVSYPVVAFASDVSRFVLPYQPGFEAAAADPRERASYVVVAPQDARDEIAARHPSVERGRLDGFASIYASGRYTIFERIAGRAEKPAVDEAREASLDRSWDVARGPVAFVLAAAVLLLALYASARLARRRIA